MILMFKLSITPYWVLLIDDGTWIKFANRLHCITGGEEGLPEDDIWLLGEGTADCKNFRALDAPNLKFYYIKIPITKNLDFSTLFYSKLKRL